MGKKLELKGTKFGRLTVFDRAEATPQGHYKWLCIRDCGNEVVVRGSALTNGSTKSCGCLQKERAAEAMFRHGAAAGGHEDPIYILCKAMKQRCLNPRHKDYKYYGGRGIGVDSSWLGADGYSHFATDMGARPEGGTLERIDNKKGYGPSNCRWSTRLEQGRNKSNNHLLTLDETTRCVAEWSEILGINEGTLYNRVNRYGWSDERSLTEEVRRAS